LKGYIISFALSNKRDNDKLLQGQMVLNMLTVIIIMVFFHVLRYHFRKMEIQADIMTSTPSDFTIEVDNLPLKATNQEIEEWIMKFSNERQPLNIKRIVRTYDINQYIKLVNRKKELEVQKAQLCNDQNQKVIVGWKEKKGRIERELVRTSKEIKGLKDSGTLKKCPIAYITFDTPQEAQYMQKKFQQSFTKEFLHRFISTPEDESLKFHDRTVEVKRAPEPTDILWNNLNVSNQKRFKARIISFMITCVIIVICFALIIGINWIQEHFAEEFGGQWLSFLASVIIVGTNYILVVITEYIAKCEKHMTYTHYLKGVAEKIATSQFLNTALSNMLAKLILADNNSLTDKILNLNFYGDGIFC